MADMDMQDRIARRIVASVYSWYEIDKGRAYAFLDSHARPSYYVARNARNSYRVIKFDKAKFSSQQGRAMFNAVLMALKTGADIDAFGDCVRYDRTISAGKAVAPLLRELGMTVPEFESLFRVETDFSSGSGLLERRHPGWRVVFEKGTRSPEQVLPLLDRVDELLGGFSKALSYGIVEIKEDLPPRVLADYNPKNDSMRVKSDFSDGRILHSFIHELAHRLWVRLMSDGQRLSVRRRYMSMKGVAIVVPAGTGATTGGADVFPSEYSTSSAEEFFAECFAYWRGGGLCDSLADFMERVFSTGNIEGVSGTEEE